jgi:Leucine-rich repeat (LRR) protein
MGFFNALVETILEVKEGVKVGISETKEMVSDISEIISDVNESAKYDTKIPQFVLKKIKPFASAYDIDELKFDGCLTWEDYDKKLLKIENLYIENKGIYEITSDFSDLLEYSNIKNLSLKGNKIKELPWNVTLKKSKLISLDLSYNQITNIPNTFEGCYSLKKMNLSHNKIDKIGDKFMDDSYYYLEILDLSFNKIKELPFNIRFRNCLKVLNLSNNCIYHSIGGLPSNLEVLDLSHNLLQTSDVFFGLEKLKILNLTSNKINEKLSYELKICSEKNGLVLSFEDNPIYNESDPYEKPYQWTEEDKYLLNQSKTYINHCWRCGSKINSIENEKCNICGFYKCSSCGACFCQK